jgi:hypothetical protein
VHKQQQCCLPFLSNFFLSISSCVSELETALLWTPTCMHLSTYPTFSLHATSSHGLAARLQVGTIQPYSVLAWPPTLMLKTLSRFLSPCTLKSYACPQSCLSSSRYSFYRFFNDFQALQAAVQPVSQAQSLRLLGSAALLSLYSMCSAVCW